MASSHGLDRGFLPKSYQISARQFLTHLVSGKALFYFLGESELVTVVGTGLLFYSIFAFRPVCFSLQCLSGKGHLGLEDFLSVRTLEDFNTAVWCFFFFFFTSFKYSCSALSCLSLQCGFDASDTF